MFHTDTGCLCSSAHLVVKAEDQFNSDPCWISGPSRRSSCWENNSYSIHGEEKEDLKVLGKYQCMKSNTNSLCIKTVKVFVSIYAASRDDSRADRTCQIVKNSPALRH